MSSFTTEQQEYLKGFFAGVTQSGDFGSVFVGETANGLITASATDASTNQASPTVHGVSINDLCKEERIKYEEHGLDIWDKLLDNAARNKFPEGGDVFRYKFHGLFYVSPAQESLMLRCRIPGCVLRADQLEGLADIAEDWGGKYAHVTTRGNIQIREIMPKDSVEVLLKLRDIGLTSQGAGADNIRNITASPASGFDPDEIIDVLPYARAMHHYILNKCELYDLPRKFNIAFDSGSSISVCADTNDIAFYAVMPKPESGIGHRPHFRVQLCGITGHKQFASDTGLLIPPEQSVAVAAAMIMVFREHGDRTNRGKARLKYLVDKWGMARFLEETQKRLAFPLQYVALELCEPRKHTLKHGYIGPHQQAQDGYSYIGINVPVGRLDTDQMRGLAILAKEYGHSELRLTVWQNILLPHVRTERVSECIAKIHALGLSTERASIRNGLVACTGNKGCKYAATDTKGHALALAKALEEKVKLEEPVNIHFTGCPHSCAQHYIGDIGLVGCKVPVGDTKVEGYHIVVGGGVDNDQGIARELANAVPFEKVPQVVEQLLSAYTQRKAGKERFVDFIRRHDVPTLQTFITI